MTNMSAAADITMRFNAWLKRFSPPRQIANNQQAMKDDAQALVRTFISHAPAEGWQDWFERAIRTLEGGMTTRAWPAPGEVFRACRSAQQEVRLGAQGGTGDAQAMGFLIEWLNCFGTQMPGMGSCARTRTLIQRGILQDTADARARGFTIDPDEERALLTEHARRRAAGEPLASVMGEREHRRHVAILARIWGISEDDSIRRSDCEASTPAHDLSRNFVADDLGNVS